MVYESCKDLVRRAVSNKVLRDEVFNFTVNSKYDGCQCGPASIIYRFKKKIPLVLVLAHKQELVLKNSNY